VLFRNCVIPNCVIPQLCYSAIVLFRNSVIPQQSTELHYCGMTLLQNDSIVEYCIIAEVQKKFKKSYKKVLKKVLKKVQKKVQNKLQIVGGE
jgi:hypothetical protein